MPYKSFRRVGGNIVATKVNGKKIRFHTTSKTVARKRASIREAFAHMRGR